MDVGDPSDLARLAWLHPEPARSSSALDAIAIDDETTLRTMRRVHEECGYLLDPHSAVGWAALDARPAGA
jgi:threonine synthase